MGQVVAGNLWGWVFQLAIPQEEVLGFDLKFLELFIPCIIALGWYNIPFKMIKNLQLISQILLLSGVHTVGNVGRIKGSYNWALIGASSMLLLKYWDIDGMSIAAFASSSLFEARSAQWRRAPSPRHSLCR